MSRKNKNKEHVSSHRRSSFAAVMAFAKDHDYIQVNNDCIRLTELGKRMVSLLPPIPPDMLARMKEADEAYLRRQGEQS